MIGLIRFSYPALGGFKINHPDTQARIDYLYSPKRLEERFKHFELLTLPALRLQTDPDFRLVVVTGEALPANAFTRLQSLLANIPQAVIVQMPPMRHRTAMHEAVLAQLPNPDAPSIQFRLDDDDAVAVDFVERTRLAALAVQPLTLVHPYVGLDFMQGHYVELSPQGVHLAPALRPCLGVALSIIAPPNPKRTILTYGHHKLPEKMPVLSFSDSAMYLNSKHAHNDSMRGAAHEAGMPLALEVEEKMLHQRFGVDASSVRQIMSGAHDKA
ncbi:glycosyltransferase [Algirhabdus cladophorae]|uniref:glycosyltransferase n=1 Tax=Algirhabdus cladophorae TaxID=3377108 RepID=UPI003B845A93